MENLRLLVVVGSTNFIEIPKDLVIQNFKFSPFIEHPLIFVHQRHALTFIVHGDRDERGSQYI